MIKSKVNSDEYRDNWDKIFKGKDMKKHVEQITGDTPHTVILDESKFEDILDKLTQRNQEMGLYDKEE